MATIVFDTYAYIKKLRAVGFTEEQAAVQAETIAGLIDDQSATKGDLAELEQQMNVRIKELDTSPRQEIKEMELRLAHHVREVESRMTIKLGAMMPPSIAIVAALVKLL